LRVSIYAPDDKYLINIAFIRSSSIAINDPETIAGTCVQQLNSPATVAYNSMPVKNSGYHAIKTRYSEFMVTP
jgi:hypothetical protein